MSPVSPEGKPTLEYWDQVKRNLDSMHNVAKRAGDKEQAADIDALRKSLIGKLDKAVPEYADARGVASTLFKAEDALDAGEKAVTSRMSVSEIVKGMGRMSAEERTLFREGYVSGLVDKVSGLSDRRSILNAINASPDARRRTVAILGRDGARRLDTFMRTEGVMDRLRTELGNSTTARQLIEAGLAGGYLSGVNPVDPSTWGNAPRGLMYGALVQGARMGALKVDQRVADRVGRLLASNDPAEFQRAIDLVNRSPTLGAAIKRIEDFAYRGALPALIGGETIN